MASDRKFYKTTYMVEVLTEGPFTRSNLSSIAHEISEGEASGVVRREKEECLTGPEMVKELIAQGSDPEFLSLDDEGNDLDE